MDGGGLTTRAPLRLINSTIANNSIPQGRYGGGMRMQTSLDSVLIMNSIFHGNYGSNGNYNGIYVASGKLIAYNSYFRTDNSPTGNSAMPVVRGGNNIFSDTDPFVGSSSNDYTLATTSNTIGGGIATATLYGTTYDARVPDYNGSNRPRPGGSSPDMGAI